MAMVPVVLIPRGRAKVAAAVVTMEKAAESRMVAKGAIEIMPMRPGKKRLGRLPLGRKNQKLPVTGLPALALNLRRERKDRRGRKTSGRLRRLKDGPMAVGTNTHGERVVIEQLLQKVMIRRERVKMEKIKKKRTGKGEERERKG